MPSNPVQKEESRAMGKKLFGVFGIALGVLTLWIILAVIEAQIVINLDKKIRQNRDIFLNYVERLPEMLDGSGKGYWFNCESHRTGVLWEYEICLNEVSQASFLSKCDPPFFSVEYFPPDMYFNPIPNPGGRRVFDLQRNKDICYEHELELD